MGKSKGLGEETGSQEEEAVPWLKAEIGALATRFPRGAIYLPPVLWMATTGLGVAAVAALLGLPFLVRALLVLLLTIPAAFWWMSLKMLPLELSELGDMAASEELSRAYLESNLFPNNHGGLKALVALAALRRGEVDEAQEMIQGVEPEDASEDEYHLAILRVRSDVTCELGDYQASLEHEKAYGELLNEVQPYTSWWTDARLAQRYLLAGKARESLTLSERLLGGSLAPWFRQRLRHQRLLALLWLRETEGKEEIWNILDSDWLVDPDQVYWAQLTLYACCEGREWERATEFYRKLEKAPFDPESMGWLWILGDAVPALARGDTRSVRSGLSTHPLESGLPWLIETAIASLEEADDGEVQSKPDFELESGTIVRYVRAFLTALFQASPASAARFLDAYAEAQEDLGFEETEILARRFDLAALLDESGDTRAAAEILERLDLDPLGTEEKAAVRNLHAWCLLRAGRDLETAYRLARKAADARPDALFILDTLACAEVLTDRVTKRTVEILEESEAQLRPAGLSAECLVKARELLAGQRPDLTS